MLERLIPSRSPNYPVGKITRDIVPGTPVGKKNLGLLDLMVQYREFADVSVLWDRGKWYMYLR